MAAEPDTVDQAAELLRRARPVLSPDAPEALAEAARLAVRGRKRRRDGRRMLGLGVAAGAALAALALGGVLLAGGEPIEPSATAAEPVEVRGERVARPACADDARRPAPHRPRGRAAPSAPHGGRRRPLRCAGPADRGRCSRCAPRTPWSPCSAPSSRSRSPPAEPRCGSREGRVRVVGGRRPRSSSRPGRHLCRRDRSEGGLGRPSTRWPDLDGRGRGARERRATRWLEAPGAVAELTPATRGASGGGARRPRHAPTRPPSVTVADARGWLRDGDAERAAVGGRLGAVPVRRRLVPRSGRSLALASGSLEEAAVAYDHAVRASTVAQRVPAGLPRGADLAPGRSARRWPSSSLHRRPGAATLQAGIAPGARPRAGRRCARRRARRPRGAPPAAHRIGVRRGVPGRVRAPSGCVYTWSERAARRSPSRSVRPPLHTAFREHVADAARRSPSHPLERRARSSEPPAAAVSRPSSSSRHLDHEARRLKAEGRGHYTIASAGHEGNAAVAAALHPGRSLRSCTTARARSSSRGPRRPDTATGCGMCSGGSIGSRRRADRRRSAQGLRQRPAEHPAHKPPPSPPTCPARWVSPRRSSGRVASAGPAR